MKSKLIFILAVILVMSVPLGSVSANSPVVYYEIASQDIGATRVQMDFKVFNFSVAYAGQMMIEFDAQTLEAIEIIGGNALNIQDANVAKLVERMDNEGGTITYAATKVGKNAPMVAEGILFSVIFEKKQQKVYDFTLGSQSMISNHKGEIISLEMNTNYDEELQILEAEANPEEGIYVRHNNPAVFTAMANRPVNWTVTVKDTNGVAVGELVLMQSRIFEGQWAPNNYQSSGEYTVQFKAVDIQGNSKIEIKTMDVYNFATKIQEVYTTDIDGNIKSIFKSNNMVQVNTKVKGLEGENGVVIIKAMDPQNRPYAIRYANAAFVVDEENNYSLGFNLQGAAKGTHTINVYIWKGIKIGDPLSEVGSFQFTVE